MWWTAPPFSPRPRRSPLRRRAVLPRRSRRANEKPGHGRAEEYGEPITFKHIDMLVNAMGVRSYNPLQEQLAGLDCKVVVVGDASSTKNGYKNIREGFNAGNAI